MHGLKLSIQILTTLILKTLVLSTAMLSEQYIFSTVMLTCTVCGFARNPGG